MASKLNGLEKKFGKLTPKISKDLERFKIINSYPVLKMSGVLRRLPRKIQRIPRIISRILPRIIDDLFVMIFLPLCLKKVIE